MRRLAFLCLLLLGCTAMDTGWANRNVTAWGDSLTDGQPFTRAESYPTALATLLPDRVVTNEGIGGETSTQVLARMLADTTHRHDVTVIWMGRNNLQEPGRIEADVAAAVKSLGSSRYIVLSILNGDFYGTEVKGSAGYDNIIGVNASFAFRYPNNYLDIRSFLVSLYDPSNPQDIQDHLNDIPPSSLRAHWNGGIDLLHLSPEANTRVAERIARLIEERSW
ncbi:MAG: SGNH/GDSL hydrolase family protein [Gemmatimonadaceae bacterium]